MGFMMCVGQCIGCRSMISFNPRFVPSFTVNGSREPICESCFHVWNQIHRTEKNLPALPLDPRAYQPEAEGEGSFEGD